MRNLLKIAWQLSILLRFTDQVATTVLSRDQSEASDRHDCMEYLFRLIVLFKVEASLVCFAQTNFESEKFFNSLLNGVLNYTLPKQRELDWWWNQFYLTRWQRMQNLKVTKALRLLSIEEEAAEIGATYLQQVCAEFEAVIIVDSHLYLPASNFNF